MERDIHRLEEIGIEASKQKEKDRDDLIAYRALGTVEEFAAYKQAESEGRLLPDIKIGSPYAGICRELHHTKKGWKTKSWVETGIVTGFDTCIHATADRSGHDHRRPLDELGTIWFIGDDAKEAAEAALAVKEERE